MRFPDNFAITGHDLRGVLRSTQELSSSLWGRAVLAAALSFYVFIVYRTAWVSDDAFISLRTVSNFLNGYGLRWNVDERVQTFTHPLWLFVLTAAHAITNEPFYSTLFVSLAFCVAVSVCLFFLFEDGGFAEGVLASLLISFSKSFVDFSTSGLENTCTHLLLVLFVLAATSSHSPTSRYSRLAMLTGLAALNRLDTVLLVLPTLALHVPRAARVRAIAVPLILAGLPLLAWEAFSLVY
jgi:arabinofuranosyltransferase